MDTTVSVSSTNTEEEVTTTSSPRDQDATPSDASKSTIKAPPSTAAYQDATISDSSTSTGEDVITTLSDRSEDKTPSDILTSTASKSATPYNAPTSGNATPSKAANLDATISNASTSASTTEEKVTTNLPTRNQDPTHYDVQPSTASKGTSILN